MRYVIDVHAVPPLVVLITASDDEALVVAQSYANQVGRPLVVATGAAPANATVRPVIPALETTGAAPGD